MTWKICLAKDPNVQSKTASDLVGSPRFRRAINSTQVHPHTGTQFPWVFGLVATLLSWNRPWRHEDNGDLLDGLADLKQQRWKTVSSSTSFRRGGKRLFITHECHHPMSQSSLKYSHVFAEEEGVADGHQHSDLSVVAISTHHPKLPHHQSLFKTSTPSGRAMRWVTWIRPAITALADIC